MQKHAWSGNDDGSSDLSDYKVWKSIIEPTAICEVTGVCHRETGAVDWGNIK